MFDSNLLFTNNGTVSATVDSAILDLSKTGVLGAWVKLAHTGVVGGAPASGAQMTATLQFSDSATFAGTPLNGPQLVVNQNTAGFRVSKLVQTEKRYARIRYTITGSSPSFTGVYAGVVSGPERDDVSGVNTY